MTTVNPRGSLLRTEFSIQYSIAWFIICCPELLLHVYVAFKTATLVVKKASAVVARITSLLRLVARDALEVIWLIRFAETVATLVVKVFSAANARAISLVRLAPRAVRVVISLLRLAVIVARLVARLPMLVVRLVSAADARAISLVRLAPRVVRVVISLLRLADKAILLVVKLSKSAIDATMVFVRAVSRVEKSPAKVVVRFDKLASIVFSAVVARCSISVRGTRVLEGSGVREY